MDEIAKIALVIAIVIFLVLGGAIMAEETTIETSTPFTLADQDTEHTCQIKKGEDGFNLYCLDGAE